jgi:hypothetical protein
MDYYHYLPKIGHPFGGVMSDYFQQGRKRSHEPVEVSSNKRAKVDTEKKERKHRSRVRRRTELEYMQKEDERSRMRMLNADIRRRTEAYYMQREDERSRMRMLNADVRKNPYFTTQTGQRINAPNVPSENLPNQRGEPVALTNTEQQILNKSRSKIAAGKVKHFNYDVDLKTLARVSNLRKFQEEIDKGNIKPPKFEGMTDENIDDYVKSLKHEDVRDLVHSVRAMNKARGENAAQQIVLENLEKQMSKHGQAGQLPSVRMAKGGAKAQKKFLEKEAKKAEASRKK